MGRHSYVICLYLDLIVNQTEETGCFKSVKEYIDGQMKDLKTTKASKLYVIQSGFDN